MRTKYVYVISFEGVQTFSTARKALETILSWGWDAKNLITYDREEVETLLCPSTLKKLITCLNKTGRLNIGGHYDIVEVTRCLVR